MRKKRGRGCAHVKVVILVVLVLALLIRRNFVELDAVVSLFSTERVRLVDFCGLREFAILLELASLVGRVLLNDVGFVVLEVAEGDEDDVALVDPDLHEGSRKEVSFVAQGKRVGWDGCLEGEEKSLRETTDLPSSDRPLPVKKETRTFFLIFPRM
jgi:hypothetical protein